MRSRRMPSRRRLRPPRARDDVPARSHPCRARPLPRPSEIAGGSRRPLRGTRDPGVSRVWRAGPWVHPGLLRRLRARSPRRLQLQGQRLLPLLRRPPDGRHRGPSRRPGAARRPDPAVGAHAAVSAPLPLRLECATDERCLARVSPRGVCRPATPSRSALRHSQRAVRLGHVPATRKSAQKEEAPADESTGAYEQAPSE